MNSQKVIDYCFGRGEEKEGCSGAICKCGYSLYIKTPQYRNWYNIACPFYGFKIQLSCGKKGRRLGEQELYR